MRLPKILSPAGSWEAMRAAIYAGADAVYFGVEQLNMRAKSVHAFTVDDLAKVAEECHQAKVACYLTLNTVLYDHDIQLAKRIIHEAKKCKIDAIIASDYAAIELCRKEKIPVHISTQANVSNFESVKYFSSLADVIVLARELTLKQTAAIVKEIKRKNIKGPSGDKLKIEIFAHGALCMAISGKCYLSLHEQNASANRGACTQNCRHEYKVIDTETNSELLIENEYIMSSKDLCTIHILNELVSSGVDVLKIEGRTKSAEYVYEVTKCYKEALQAIRDGNYTSEKISAWQQRLTSVYNRGFWEGYYLGRKMGEWSDTPGSKATERKVYVGKSTKYYPKIKVVEFLLEAGSIKRGDELLIIGTEKGIVRHVLDKMKVNGLLREEAYKGDSLTFPLDEKAGRADKLYKTVKTEYG